MSFACGYLSHTLTKELVKLLLLIVQASWMMKAQWIEQVLMLPLSGASYLGLIIPNWNSCSDDVGSLQSD